MTDNNLEFRIWQTQLYHLQREAPKPFMIKCSNLFVNKPSQYGLEYHGPISRQETEELLKDAPSGAYLIRESQRSTNAYTLVIWFDNVARNYKLFYDAEREQHYVGEKRFDSIELLVADGLIHFNIETRGADVLKKIAENNVYEKSPFYKMRYHTLLSPALSLPANTGSLACTQNKSVPKPLITEATPQEKQADPFVKTPLSRRLSVDVSELHQDTASRRCTTVLENVPSADADGSDGRRYREWPPLVKLSINEEMVTESSALTPPVPPPRSASGLKIPSVYAESPLNELCTELEPFESPAGGSKFRHEQIGIADSTLIKSNRPVNNGLVNKLTTPGGSSFNVSKELSNATHPVPSVSSPTSHSPNVFVSPNNLDNIKTSSFFNATSLGFPISMNREDPSVMSNSPNALSSGSKQQAVLNLCERYKLPAECLADQLVIVETDRKKHNFKVHTFIGLNWCHFCMHFIWGLVAQGVKCTDCGFPAHKRCSDQVPDDCLPDVKQMKRVFGVDLTSLAIAERKPVPTLLERCVREIETRGALVYEGLYRVPGNHDRIEQLRVAFDKDSESAVISQSRVPDINVITSLIKTFFRELPVPLITFDVYPKLLDIVRDNRMTEEEKLHNISSVLTTLPVAHYETLRFFMRHIHRVAVNHEKNMMSANNLATVLAPSLMSSSYPDPKSCLLGMQDERALVQLLIRDFNTIFTNKDRVVRRHGFSEPTHYQPDRPNSQVLSPATALSNRPVPRLPEQNKRRFLRNRRSVDAPLLAAPASSKSPT